MVKETVGKRIYKLRKEFEHKAKKENKKYWSRKEFAKRVGLKPGSLWDIETGRTKVPKNLKLFAKELGVTEEFLLNGETSNEGLNIKDIVINFNKLNTANQTLVYVLIDKLLKDQQEVAS